jgi:hypothetical protein
MDTQDHIYLPILLQIAAICTKRKEKFHFHHVNSHVCILGNEIADILAKIAADILPREAFPMYDIKFSDHNGISHIPRGATLVSPWSDTQVTPADETALSRLLLPELHTHADQASAALLGENPTSPQRYVWFNLKADVKHARKKLYTWWQEADRAKDKWTARFQAGREDSLVTRFLKPLNSIPISIANLVRRCRYNQFLTNGSERLKTQITQRGLSTRCPLCDSPSAPDNQLHALGPCTHTQIKAAQTKHHDKVVQDCASLHTAESQDQHTIFADIEGHRPTSPTTRIAQALPTEERQTAPDALTPEETIALCDLDPADPPIGPANPTTDTLHTPTVSSPPPDDILNPYTFAESLDTELQRMADQTDSPHNYVGSLHKLTQSKIFPQSPAGTYRLLELHIHQITHTIWADLEHLESGATHRTRWANINRYRSRTIPQIIDSDTSLCPDLFRIIGLPTGEPIPARPDPKYTLQIGDIAFGRDSDLGEARTRKRSKYEPLLAKWHAQGWQVDTEVHVIAIGHRGGIPAFTGHDARHLGLCHATKDPAKICLNWSRLAYYRLGDILLQRRGLEHSPQYAHKSAIAARVWLPKPNTAASNT